MDYRYWRLHVCTAEGEERDIYKRVPVTGAMLPLGSQGYCRMLQQIVEELLANPQVKRILYGKMVSEKEYDAEQWLHWLLGTPGVVEPSHIYVKAGGFRRKGEPDTAVDLPWEMNCALEPELRSEEWQMELMLAFRDMITSRYPSCTADTYEVISQEEYEACLAEIDRRLAEMEKEE